MLKVKDAFHIMMSAITHTPKTQILPLLQAKNYVLAKDYCASFSKPEAPLSAMDGYAVMVGTKDTVLDVIGESSAGHGYEKAVEKNQAVRIFTGAPLPPNTDRVVIQEHVSRDGNKITIKEHTKKEQFIRPKGMDYTIGQTLLRQGTKIKSQHIALLADIGCHEVCVYQKPKIAILSTGNEMIMPFEARHKGQYFASNSYSLYTQIAQYGGDPTLLGVAKDTIEDLQSYFAKFDAFDIFVTTGGASVGKYDLMREITKKNHIEVLFDKIAMRPGKPCLFGKRDQSFYIGFAGNPISSYIGARVFLKNFIEKWQGQSSITFIDDEAIYLPLEHSLPAHHERQEYARAVCHNHQSVSVMQGQDSSLLSVLAQSNALVIREPFHKELQKNTLVKTILL